MSQRINPKQIVTLTHEANFKLKCEQHIPQLPKFDKYTIYCYVPNR